MHLSHRKVDLFIVVVTPWRQTNLHTHTGENKAVDIFSSPFRSCNFFFEFGAVVAMMLFFKLFFALSSGDNNIKSIPLFELGCPCLSTSVATLALPMSTVK